jgi:hypothetical protein
MSPLVGVERALARLRPGWLPEAAGGPLGEAFSAAGRLLGKGAFTLEEEESRALGTAAEGWGLDELGRVALLLQPGVNAEGVERCYFRGDNRERQAVLKALPFLPEPARLVALGVEACRTSVEDVFRAIACRNPFPARHFPPAGFNQMVLKAIFIGVSVSEIEGLAERVTPELLRMADDFAAERRAAGRTVPNDIATLHALAQKGTS